MKMRLFFIFVSTLVLSTALGLADSFTLNLPNGNSAIGDPLDNSGGHWPSQMNPTGALDGSYFSLWNCNGGWIVYTFDSAMATGFGDATDINTVSAPVMSPGGGAFINNNSGAATSVTFTGTPGTPVLPVPLPCGCGHYYLLTLQTLGAGTYQNITGLSPQTGAQVQQWNGSQWTTNTFSNGTWSPTPPSLTNGAAALFYVPCPCITLTRFSNKTISCSTNWNFDAPTNIVDLCCTNYNLTFSTITNSGPCPLVLTRVWLITDACGNSTNCSQTVTVVSTNPPVLNCASNKTVQCGTLWSFNAPMVTDACSGSNVVITVASTVTNGVCPQVITQTWLVIDACGNTTNCSQTVTVLSGPPLAHTPAKIPLCTDSNGCAVMPDATSLVWLSGPTPLWVQGNDATVSQSIPPGTTLCSSTNVLFAAVGSCCATNIISVPVVLLPYGCCCETAGVNLQFLDFPATTVTPVTGTTMILPGYGPVRVDWTCSPSDFSIAYSVGAADATQPQFTYGDPYNPHPGEYDWTAVPNLGFYKTNSATNYTVTFTFLGVAPPDPSQLFLCVAGLYDTSTAMVSQPGYLAGEYQLPLPNCNSCGIGDVSAITLLNGITETPGVPGAAGLTLSSAFDPLGTYYHIGDQRNTGYALFQVTSNVAANVLTVTMIQTLGDGLGLSLAYETNPCPPLVAYYPTNIDVCISNINGCGLMPNVTGQLQVMANAQVTQSIPPGTTLCADTNVILTVTNACGEATNLTVPITLVVCKPPCTNIVVVCPSPKTVQCGSGWTFDPPLAASCCGSNVTVTTTDTVTNGGVCLINFIGGGSAAVGVINFIGNTAISGYLDITAGSKMGTYPLLPGSGSFNGYFYWDGMIFPASDPFVHIGGLLFTGGGFEINLFGNGPGSYSLLGAPPAYSPNVTAGAATIAVCPQTITRTWLIADDCGHTTNCSQTVTVVSTNPPVLNCASNKTVQCGTPWRFNAPMVTDACSGSNVVITVTSTVTNGVCPQVITQTWLVIDACGNTTNCSQTVTVVDTTPPVLNCASNKTVQCGTAWSFDAPTASDSCSGTNVTLTILSTVTNGVCPQVITQTWLVIDACGNTTNCSQTVTVVDTTPPVINCPTNAVIVALNKNCQLVIPYISVSATDNCTPLCSLIYSQSPTNGTIVAGHSQTVTVTVTDACGNSSHCLVTVIGVDKTGPVLSGPATLSVTNCLVPCVTNFFTVSDNCCPQSSLKITQSPACNTPLGPGINSITVTVTDCNGNSTKKVVHLSIGGPESFLGNLFNTGVNGIGALLPDAAEDNHYSLPYTAVPSGVPADYFGYAVAVSDECHVAPSPCFSRNDGNNCYLYVPWSLPPDPATAGSGAVSKWIGPDYTNNVCCPGGGYTYTQTFQFPSNLDPTTAWLAGRVAADNFADIYLNGNFLGDSMYTSWSFFQSTPGMIVQGQNTLKFIVYGPIGYTGLRVEYMNALANCSTCAPPAIVSMTGSQTLPLFSTAAFHVNASGTPPLTYQWYHNGVPLSNNGHDYNVTTPTLLVHPLNYGDAGTYSVVVSDPCGSVTNRTLLRVVFGWPWNWGWWNIAQLDNPLAASVGPDLNLVGSSVATNYAITAGTTPDFGLPEQGGQIVNVMHISPQAAASIQVPLIAPPGSNSVNSYTIIEDIYKPGTSFGTPSTLFQSRLCCIGSSGQDGVTLTLDATNNLHIAGSTAGVPYDYASATPMTVDAWHRVALVVDGPQADGTGGHLTAYLDGQTAVLPVLCPCCIIIHYTGPNTGPSINWSNGSPTVFSVQTNGAAPNAEFYVSSIQFHAVALTPQQLAGIGPPDNGPAPANDTSVGPQPVLSAALANGSLSFSWTGSPFVLQETTDLTSGQWTDSTLPFSESQVGVNILTTAVANPVTEGPSKFYRLIFRP